MSEQRQSRAKWVWLVLSCLFVIWWVMSTVSGCSYRGKTRKFICARGRVVSVWMPETNLEHYSNERSRLSVWWDGISGIREIRIDPLVVRPDYMLPLWMPAVLCILFAVSYWRVRIRQRLLRFITVFALAAAFALFVFFVELSICQLLEGRSREASLGRLIAVLVFAALAFFAFARWLHVRLSPVVRRGYCPLCGFNLRGNVSDRCPECGHAVRVDDESNIRLPAENNHGTE